MKRKIAWAVLCLSCAFRMEAETVAVTINGLNYNLISDNTGRTAVLTDNQDYEKPVLTVLAEVVFGGRKHIVTGIEPQAFTSNKHIKSVIFSRTLTTVGNRAFAYCDSLTSITIAGTVENFGYSVFEGCTSVKSVTIMDGVKSLGERTFYGFKALTSVTIPGSVERLENNVFQECESLASVTFPNNLKSIGMQAFASCRSLTAADLPNGVTSIGEAAFFDCNLLTSIILPDNMAILKEAVFRSCNSLKSITIKKRTTILESFALADCPNLQDIYIEWTKPDEIAVGDRVFYGASMDCRVHIPKGTEEQYRWYDNGDNGPAATWAGLSIAINHYTVAASASDPAAGSVTGGRNSYILYRKAELTATPATGYSFVEWTDADSNGLSTDNPYLLTVTGDATVQAHFAAKSYIVSLSAINGRITSGNGIYSYGTKITVSADAAYGYRLVKWTDANGDSISAESSFTLTVAGTTSLQAHFAKSNYNINLIASGNGVITSGKGIHAHDATVKAEASAGRDSHFIKWTNASGEKISADNPYLFTATSDTVLFACFGENEYVVKTTFNPLLGWTEGVGMYAYEEEVVLTAYAHPGFQFIEWITADGLHISTNPYREAKIKGDIAMTVVFEADGKAPLPPVVGNEILPAGEEAQVYYADGTLHLVNLEGYILSVRTITGREVLQFKAGSADEYYPVALPVGIYILTPTSPNLPAGSRPPFREIGKFVVR